MHEIFIEYYWKRGPSGGKHKTKYQSKFVIKQKQTGKNAVNDIYKMS